MKYIQELTVWTAGFAVPNHTYYVNDSKTKMVGYIKEGSTHLMMFTRPMSLDRRGRKFAVLARRAESDSVYFTKETPVVQSSNTITVEGSKGSKYFITKSGDNYVCQCPGFMFRRKCKHIDVLKEKT